MVYYFGDVVGLLVQGAWHNNSTSIAERNRAAAPGLEFSNVTFNNFSIMAGPSFNADADLLGIEVKALAGVMVATLPSQSQSGGGFRYQSDAKASVNFAYGAGVNLKFGLGGKVKGLFGVDYTASNLEWTGVTSTTSFNNVPVATATSNDKVKVNFSTVGVNLGVAFGI
jgi:hypothetical protein